MSIVRKQRKRAIRSPRAYMPRTVKEMQRGFRDRSDGQRRMVKDYMANATGIWYWAWGILAISGKSALLGPYSSPDEAEQMGYSTFNSNYRVEALPTRDEHKATRMLKHQRLDSGVGLEKAMERVRHRGKDIGIT